MSSFLKVNGTANQTVGSREIAFDCKFFLGDRPCVWHKQSGVLCPCDHYEQVEERLLIIKLDAMGDVLRSTALLPPLAEAHPRAAITWITREESVPLLQRNPYVAEVLKSGPRRCCTFRRGRSIVSSIWTHRKPAPRWRPRHDPAERMDSCSTSRGTCSRPTSRRDAGWRPGSSTTSSGRAQRPIRIAWPLFSASPGVQHRYVFELGDDERARARTHLASIGLDSNRPVIGLNTGAGGRWPLKQWREEGYVELIARLARRADVQFLLLGGPGERDRNERLKAASRVPLFDSGCDNAVRHFAAIVSHCDVVVTGDTLAMHLSLALGKRTVVLFGPTSAAEIELYGLGEKVVPEMGCLSCYKTSCDFVPNCMDLISTDMVERAVLRQLTLVPALTNPLRLSRQSS